MVSHGVIKAPIPAAQGPGGCQCQSLSICNSYGLVRWRGRPTDRGERPAPRLGGTISYNTTRYEYDQACNRTKTITPRGVATTDDRNDFAEVDALGQ